MKAKFFALSLTLFLATFSFNSYSLCFGTHCFKEMYNKVRESISQAASRTIDYVEGMVGDKYVWGAEGPRGKGADCSGLITHAIKETQKEKGVKVGGRLTTAKVDEDLQKPENKQYIVDCASSEESDLVLYPPKSKGGVGHIVMRYGEYPGFIGAQGGKKGGVIKQGNDINYREGAVCFKNFYVENNVTELSGEYTNKIYAVIEWVKSKAGSVFGS